MTSVALIVLDTLRKDYFDQYFEWLPGRRFERAYSTSNWTASAHASLFTGHYPSKAGVHAKARSLDCHEPVLAERLATVGYRTRALSANVNVAPRRNWDRGFEEFVPPRTLTHPTDANTLDWEAFFAEYDTPGRRQELAALWECLVGDHATIASLKQGLQFKFGTNDVADDGARNVLDRTVDMSFADKEFLFINLMEAHTPYYPPPDYRRIDQKVSVTIEHSTRAATPDTPVKVAYESSVDYLSDIYQEIFEELIDEFDYIITLSDHGEMLGEDGRYNHTYGIYPQLTHVPLVVTGGGLDGCETKPVSLVDVYTTVLSLAGLDSNSRGQNLTGDEIAEQTHLAEYRGMIPQAVTRLRDSGWSDERIVDYEQPLHGVITPDQYIYEQLDGITVVGESLRGDPEELIDKYTADLIQHKTSPDSEETSEAVRQQLEELGYL